MKFRIILFISIIFISCQSEQDKGAASTVVPEQAIPTPKKSNANETAEMIKLIKEAQDQINPIRTIYLASSQKADILLEKFKNSQKPQEKFQFATIGGYDLINAGRNEEAIVLLGQVVELATNAGAPPASIAQAKMLLALAYMRIGETHHCLKNTNEESCIIPIEGKGIYKMTNAVETAIGIYKDMLKIDPNDFESIWMLNFAYMTLGKYPAGVPQQFRIPDKKFQSEHDIKAFKNIAQAKKVNTVGLSGGCIMDDFNNDGHLDLIATSWGFYDQVKYFENDGQGNFKDKTRESKLTGITGGLNCVQTDYNNDGYLDFFIPRGAWFRETGQIPNSLIRNNGDGTFTDVTIFAGLVSYFPTQTSIWSDVNQDGYLDLFVGNESTSTFPCNNELFLNNGDGTFKNILAEANLSASKGLVKGAAFGDVNNDGWPDLYVSHLHAKNQLFLNEGVQNGLPKFKDISISAKITEPINSFPTWFWDYNNDGLEDIFVAGYGGDQEQRTAAYFTAQNYLGKYVGGDCRVYKNNGDGTFSDETKKMGLTDAMSAMGSNFGDIDNDGYLDFYLGTGSPQYTDVIPNRLFRNSASQKFQDVTSAGRVGHAQKGHGVAFGDYDNDGDQDIFTVIGGAFQGDVYEDAFFENPGNENSWVTLKLIGAKSNRAAIGARVKMVTTNKDGTDRTIYRTVSSGSSFGGNSLQLEIGLGAANAIKELEVTWPNGDRKKITEIEVNKFHKLLE